MKKEIIKKDNIETIDGDFNIYTINFKIGEYEMELEWTMKRKINNQLQLVY